MASLIANTLSQRAEIAAFNGRGEIVKTHKRGFAFDSLNLDKMSILYIASSNAGKLRDFAVAAKVYPFDVRPLPDLEKIPAPDEDGLTFEENARLKAVYYSGFLPGELVLADDSGLEVDALGGAPGVRSARFAEDTGIDMHTEMSTDERNNAYLLERLAAYQEESFPARYRCVIAAARDGAALVATEGSVEGAIVQEPRGDGGFGYDPLFYLPGLGKTMAEIDLITKQGLSHRGKAFQKLLDALKLKKF